MLSKSCPSLNHYQVCHKAKQEQLEVPSCSYLVWFRNFTGHKILVFEPFSYDMINSLYILQVHKKNMVVCGIQNSVALIINLVINITKVLDVFTGIALLKGVSDIFNGLECLCRKTSTD